MNLIFRLLRLLLKRNTLPEISALDISYTEVRVWPLDCDFNMHLTNSRYTSLLDLARIQYLLQLRSLPKFLKGGWKSVLSSQSISFLKEIKPFSRVDITTQVLYWDRRYCYIEHRFLVSDQLHAKALARVAFIRGGRLRAFDKLLAELGENKVMASPSETRQISAWLKLLDLKNN